MTQTWLLASINVIRISFTLHCGYCRLPCGSMTILEESNREERAENRGSPLSGGGGERTTSMGCHQFLPGEGWKPLLWLFGGDLFSEFTYTSLSSVHFPFSELLVLPGLCLALEYFLARGQEPDHHCSELSPPLDIPVNLQRQVEPSWLG